ncbi:MAG: bifunctional DNA primase/polymerase [Planctomycetes bacterium]|nr:bifunctional DNA primase/polymerase [Planctomycetota bacterium]
MKIIESALKYLREGVSVIPMSPENKRPLVAWSEFQKRLPTEGEIVDMFEKNPRAMIGLVTGKISNIFVVDCDSESATKKIQEQLPDSYVCPVAQTPRGGNHFYFQYPSDKNIPTRAAIFDHCDIRGQGGCIVCPPSINSKGGKYAWLGGLELTPDTLQAPPAPLLMLMCNPKVAPLINNNKYIEGCDQLVTNNPLFSVGRRDTDLFTLANFLVKSGMPEGEIFKYLDFIVRSWGECDETWINTKVQSAFKRQEARERNLSEEIREWILVTDGHFLVTDSHKELNLVTPSISFCK